MATDTERLLDIAGIRFTMAFEYGIDLTKGPEGGLRYIAPRKATEGDLWLIHRAWIDTCREELLWLMS